jgi:hypothetical protein
MGYEVHVALILNFPLMYPIGLVDYVSGEGSSAFDRALDLAKEIALNGTPFH